jgi:hypothetical protein
MLLMLLLILLLHCCYCREIPASPMHLRFNAADRASCARLTPAKAAKHEHDVYIYILSLDIHEYGSYFSNGERLNAATLR